MTEIRANRARHSRTTSWVAALLTASGVWFFLVPSVGVTRAGIAGSVHDLSAETWSDGGICVVCHTPHHSDPVGPLWNHEMSDASYTLYESRTLVQQPEQPRGPTKLCLSCHDGTVAVDSFGGNMGGTFVTGRALIGTVLSDDHPVSIPWTHQTDLPSCGHCHDIRANPSFVSVLPFYDGYVECATCHDVHDGAGFEALLRKSTATSAICLHCHGK